MAVREIDRFGVKPMGFLAAWRYVRVMTDDLGNITVEEVPGKPFPNLPCIADYKKTDRRFAADQLITEYCNLDTYTNYRIYAQDCSPYAYAQTDLNHPACGYLQPLPEPFVPPNPFGNPTYGKYAYLDLCDDKNEPVTINIYRRRYVGAATKIKSGNQRPAILSYKNSDENKLSPLRTCEFSLTMVSDPDFNLEMFYTQDQREFKIEVLKYGITKFLGFGTAEEASEEFRATPYDVTWRATDGLGGLKEIDYPLPIGSRTEIQQNFLSMLTYCLAMTNLNLDISTVCNLYEVKMKNGLGDDPLNQASVNPLRASDKGVVFKCYKVLEQICLLFGAFLVQDNGKWNFIRQAELGNPVLRRRNYNYTGLFLNAELYFNSRVATCKGDDISMLDDNPTLRMGNAIKRAEVIVDQAEPPFLIYNGDFELWNGSNFPGFTKYGGIAISRIETQIQTTTGDIPSGNYALQFDELADNGKYLELSPVLVTIGDKISLSYNVGSTAPDLSRPYKGVDAFKLRIKVGQYYLTNQDGGNTYTWVKQLATCTNPVYNPKGNINTYTVKLDIPEVPETGIMVIELFGFTKAMAGTYYPVSIDNIAASKSNGTQTKKRTLYISQQDAFYTNVPEQTKLIWGDFTGFETEVRPVRVNVSQDIKNDYYAIRTVDGSYSTGWYEYGSSATPVPIGIALSRTILKAYRDPFRFLANTFIGNNISYLDIFNVNLPDDETGFNDRTFALLSGDFNLISGELENANYVEIFSKPGKSVDIIVPGNDGDPSPPIGQNPNPPAPPSNGIFTEEFTNEFV